jgi:RHS repeat-associated protein
MGSVDDVHDTAQPAPNRHTYKYTAFGEQTDSGALANSFTYVGRLGYYEDAPVGLYLLGARYFDPSTGRFTSPDPLGFDAGDANLYRYVGNDPVNAVDPSGHANEELRRAYSSYVGLNGVRLNNATPNGGEPRSEEIENLEALRREVWQEFQSGLRASDQDISGLRHSTFTFQPTIDDAEVERSKLRAEIEAMDRKVRTQLNQWRTAIEARAQSQTSGHTGARRSSASLQGLITSSALARVATETNFSALQAADRTVHLNATQPAFQVDWRRTLSETDILALEQAGVMRSVTPRGLAKFKELNLSFHDVYAVELKNLWGERKESTFLLFDAIDPYEGKTGIVGDKRSAKHRQTKWYRFVKLGFGHSAISAGIDYFEKLKAEDEKELEAAIDATLFFAYMIPGVRSLTRLVQGKPKEAVLAAAEDAAFYFAGGVAGKLASEAKDALWAMSAREATADLAVGLQKVKGGLQSVIQAQHLATGANAEILRSIFQATEIQAAERVAAGAVGAETQSTARKVAAAAQSTAARTPTAVGAPATAAARPVLPGTSIADDQTAAVLQAIEEGLQAPASRGIGEPVLFGQRRVSPAFSVDEAYPATSGRSLADVVSDLRTGVLTPDDLPLTAFRHPDTGTLVSMNTRTRAVLAEAGLEPSRVSIVDLASLSAKQEQKYLIRLGESPLIDSPLPGVRVPVTPSMNDLRIMSRPDGSPYIISIPGVGH